METKRVHCLVSGIVQGVFFRAHTQEWASSLSLTGWVKNLSDGRVEFVAEGPAEELKKLVDLCSKGPSAGRVESIEVEWLPATNEFREFILKF